MHACALHRDIRFRGLTGLTLLFALSGHLQIFREHELPQREIHTPDTRFEPGSPGGARARVEMREVRVEKTEGTVLPYFRGGSYDAATGKS